MRVVRACAVAVIALLMLDVIMLEVGRLGPLVIRVTFVCFILALVGIGVAVRRIVPPRPALAALLTAAVANVTLGHWIARYLSSGATGWEWLGAPVTVAIGTAGQFAMMAIGVTVEQDPLGPRTQ